MPGCSVQSTLVVLSGDGGARDFRLIDRSAPELMIGSSGVGAIESKSGAWQAGNGSIAIASFGRLTLSADSILMTPHQVQLGKGKLVRATPVEREILKELAKQGFSFKGGPPPTRVYASLTGTVLEPSRANPLTSLNVDLRNPISCGQ